MPVSSPARRVAATAAIVATLPLPIVIPGAILIGSVALLLLEGGVHHCET